MVHSRIRLSPWVVATAVGVAVMRLRRIRRLR